MLACQFNIYEIALLNHQLLPTVTQSKWDWVTVGQLFVWETSREF